MYDSATNQLDNKSNNSIQIFKTLRIQNPTNIIFGHLNINSIPSKFQELGEIIGNNFDILSLAETKIDPSFPSAQFLLNSYNEPYRLDVSSRKGGLILYVKSSLASCLLTKFSIPEDIQIIVFEINLRR